MEPREQGDQLLGGVHLVVRGAVPEVEEASVQPVEVGDVQFVQENQHSVDTRVYRPVTSPPSLPAGEGSVTFVVGEG